MVSRDDYYYYTQEMRYLNQEGLRFSEAHPDIARQLGLEGVNADLRDPHSERVLEGFAFLSGRIRKMLDRQYPELAHALFNLIFPSYLRPVPSKSICQFHSDEGMLDKPQPIPRGTEIRGQVQGKSLIFTTAHDTVIQPIDMKRVYVDPEVNADFSLSFELHLHGGVDPCVLDFDQIEFFIHGDPSTRFELFRQLHGNLSAVQVKGLSLAGDQLRVHWTGFDAEHSFFRDEDESYLPLHLLRDYFDHPERFLYFSIPGLSDALAPLLDDLQSFQLDFHFKTPFATGSKFTRDNVLLHTCSCQNAFQKAAEPMDVDGSQLEYRVVSDCSEPGMEVVSVNQVMLSRERSQVVAHPYYHFDRNSKKDEEHYFYAIRREPGEHGGWETWLRFFQLGQKGARPISGFTGSVQILATQGNVARKLKIGQLNELDRAIPETIQVRNVTQATAPCWPQLYRQSDWAFIAHLALNYRDIQDLQSLKTLLTLYNFNQSETIKRKINGLNSLDRTRDYLIQMGRVLNGFTLTLCCDEDKFQHGGDVMLFGRVLGEYLKAYCPFNSFIRLVIEVGHHEQVLETIVTG